MCKQFDSIRRRFAWGMLALIAICAVAMFAGCSMPTQTEVQQLAQSVNDLNSKVDQFQADAMPLIDLLGKEGLIDGDQTEKLIAGLDKAQKDMARITDPLLAADLGEDGVLGMLEALRIANAGSALINPYAPQIAIGIEVAKVTIPVILGLLGLGYGAKKNGEAKNERVALANEYERREKVEKKYQAHKRGTARFMKKADDAVEVELYDMIGDARKALNV